MLVMIKTVPARDPGFAVEPQYLDGWRAAEVHLRQAAPPSDWESKDPEYISGYFDRRAIFFHEEST